MTSFSKNSFKDVSPCGKSSTSKSSDKSRDQLFSDCSASVERQIEYFKRLAELQAANPDTRFYRWDDDCKQETADAAASWIQSRRGFGGTTPLCMVPFLDPTAATIIIMTDGQIDQRDVQRCSSAIGQRGIKMRKCILIIIQTCSHIDLSVPAAFVPHAEEFEFWLLPRGATEYEKQQYMSASRIDLSKYEGQPELFLQDIEALRKQIAAATLGTECNELHHKLCDLQKSFQRYFARLAAEQLSTSVDNIPDHEVFCAMTIEQKIAHFAAMYAASTVAATDTSTGGSLMERVNAAIQRLIAANKDTSFGTSILFGSMYRAPTVAAFSVAPPDASLTEHSVYECPVEFVMTIAALLISAGPSVFSGLERQLVEAFIRNPFLVLRYQIIVEKIKGRISQALGLTTVAEMSSSSSDGSHPTFKPFRDPLNRNPIIASLPFSSKKKYKGNISHAVSQIFFENNKLAGNQCLWLVVIWFVSRQIEYLRVTPGLMEQFDQFIRDQLFLSKSRVTLSGNPVNPIIDRPMVEAIWYCLHSFLVHGNGTGPTDRLRELYPVTDWMIELMDLVNVEIDRDFVLRRSRMCRAFAYMMRQELNKTNWRDVIRAQYQPSIVLAPVPGGQSTIVFVDANGRVVCPTTSSDLPSSSSTSSSASVSASADGYPHYYLPSVPLPAEYDGLVLSTIIGLSNLVNTYRTVGDINIPMDPSVPAVPEPVRLWTAYPIGPDEEEADFSIDVNTMRPPTIDRGIDWQTRFYTHFGMDGSDSNWLSLYSLFHRYVREHRAFPSPNEFIIWLSGTQARSERRMSTLPTFIVDWVGTLFRRYDRVDAFSLPVGTFISRGYLNYGNDNQTHQKNQSFYYQSV